MTLPAWLTLGLGALALVRAAPSCSTSGTSVICTYSDGTSTSLALKTPDGNSGVHGHLYGSAWNFAGRSARCRRGWRICRDQPRRPGPARDRRFDGHTGQRAQCLCRAQCWRRFRRGVCGRLAVRIGSVDQTAVTDADQTGGDGGYRSGNVVSGAGGGSCSAVSSAGTPLLIAGGGMSLGKSGPC